MVGIRYALSLQAYQKYLAVTVTENASDATVAAVAENQEKLPGVAIEEDTMRVYDGGEACASIIGYTGQISPEELEEKEKTDTTEILWWERPVWNNIWKNISMEKTGRWKFWWIIWDGF